mmetsp:Transcript_30585/g.53729  ORF Transcript_30585/g.53729 Transcript_30585/m.53729 type:complete len:106 (-) Transcript_30585:107-424(-)
MLQTWIACLILLASERNERNPIKEVLTSLPLQTQTLKTHRTSTHLKKVQMKMKVFFIPYLSLPSCLLHNGRILIQAIAQPCFLPHSLSYLRHSSPYRTVMRVQLI